MRSSVAFVNQHRRLGWPEARNAHGSQKCRNSPCPRGANDLLLGYVTEDGHFPLLFANGDEVAYDKCVVQ